MGLSTVYRLHHPSDFRKFFQGPDVYRLGLCTIFSIPNHCGHFRLGLTMKGRARSVDRNEIRRQVRESFRKIGAELGSRDYNVVISLQRQVRHPFPRQLAKVLQEEWPKRLKEKKAI